MQLLKTKNLTPGQAAQIGRLWDEEFIQSLNGRFKTLLDGVENYLHHLLLDEAGDVAGWTVQFEKDGETRFSIIVPAALQGKGYGKILLESLKGELDEFYGWVVDHDRDMKANGAPYRSPMPFYLKHGFEILHDQRLDTEMICAVKIKWLRHGDVSSDHYLRYHFEDTPALVSTFDELPLWSASFGLLMLKHLELRRGMTVVDAGCGAGFPLLELAERLGPSCTFYGVDTWKNALSRAAEKVSSYGVKNVSLIEASVAQMPFEEDSVDLIVSNLGINNFENPEAVFRECCRVLKPGGKLALTTNLDGHWQTFYGIFEETLNVLGEDALIEGLRAHQRRRGSVESISELFADTGFIVTRHAVEHFEMTFLDGTAFLNHHFVKLGWLSGWQALIPEERWTVVFSALEKSLNRYAEREGALRLTVPAAFIEGQKQRAVQSFTTS